jgi:hypothetical protein
VVVAALLSPRRLRGAIAIAALAWTAAAARAAEGTTVSATGDCPSDGAVAAALAVLLPDGGARATESDVRVADLGDRYVVTVGGVTERVYVDAARDCAERARVAAIFAALTLRPPQVAGEPAPVVVPRPMGLRRFAELAFATDLAPAIADLPVAVGADVRVGIGNPLAITAAVGVRSSITLPLRGGADARLTRVPVDLGLRIFHAWRTAELAFDLGVAASWLFIEGRGLPATERHARLDVGARAALLVGWRAAPTITPFGGLAGSLSPRPYELTVEGVGQAGDTPGGWIGAILGVRLDWSVEAPRGPASPP